MKVFIAQGLVNDDHLIFASNDCDTKRAVEHLPCLADVETEELEKVPSGSMQIAWRYEKHYKPRIEVNRYRTLSNNFFFKRSGLQDKFNSSNITHWPGNGPGTFQDLEETILTALRVNNFQNNRKRDDKSILRVAIQNLGSFFWNNNQKEIPRFLFRLRSICHSSRAVFLITMPKHLMEEDYFSTRSEQMSDIVISLEALNGDANPLYSEYNGLIKFIKVSPIRTLCPSVTEGKDWAFKLVKKKLIIVRLTLPPELNDSTQREQDTFSCATSNKILQF
ncbi:elongator complex protein 4 isoform X2 [Cimex lectularius]|nr:elongator complex protein 4 isoform X2 [Cimex lectularius]XP_024081503.1 elongator complex protein 4 isoform X2 [Cimex lectularius]